MEYNPEVHSIECPKCGHGMEEISYGADLLVDRCTHCKGMWFDKGEVTQLKSKWMGEALDTGKASEGRKWNEVHPVACPRCGQQMETKSDPKQPHIQYEVCEEHGMYLDAGEFTDLKNETIGDWFRRIGKRARKR